MDNIDDHDHDSANYQHSEDVWYLSGVAHTVHVSFYCKESYVEMKTDQLRH